MKLRKTLKMREGTTGTIFVALDGCEFTLIRHSEQYPDFVEVMVGDSYYFVYEDEAYEGEQGEA